MPEERAALGNPSRPPLHQPLLKLRHHTEEGTLGRAARITWSCLTCSTRRSLRFRMRSRTSSSARVLGKVGSESTVDLFHRLGFHTEHEHQVKKVRAVIQKAHQRHEKCLLVTSTRNPLKQQVSSLLQYGVSHPLSPVRNWTSSGNYTQLSRELHKRLSMCNCSQRLPHSSFSVCAFSTKSVVPDFIPYHCNMRFFSESFRAVSGIDLLSVAPQVKQHRYALIAANPTRARPYATLIMRLEDATTWPLIICSILPDVLHCSSTIRSVETVNSRSQSSLLFEHMTWTHQEHQLLMNYSDMSFFY